MPDEFKLLTHEEIKKVWEMDPDAGIDAASMHYDFWMEFLRSKGKLPKSEEEEAALAENEAVQKEFYQLMAANYVHMLLRIFHLKQEVRLCFSGMESCFLRPVTT